MEPHPSKSVSLLESKSKLCGNCVTSSHVITSTFMWLHPNLQKEWLKWDYNTPSYALLRKSYLSKWQKSTREQEELSCSASGNSTQCVHPSLMMVHFPRMTYKWEILRTVCVYSTCVLYIIEWCFFTHFVFLINVFTGSFSEHMDNNWSISHPTAAHSDPANRLRVWW